jgi:ankyrin repeat protein
MTASVGGHAEAVRLLLGNGADARYADGEGVMPLMNAAKNGTSAVLKLLAESKSMKGGRRVTSTRGWDSRRSSSTS